MTTLRVRGIMAMMNGEHAEAEEYFVEAIAMGEEVLTRPTHRYLTSAKTEYSQLLLEAGRGQEARTILDEVEPLLIERVGTPHPLVDEVRQLRERATTS